MEARGNVRLLPAVFFGSVWVFMHVLVTACVFLRLPELNVKPISKPLIQQVVQIDTAALPMLTFRDYGDIKSCIWRVGEPQRLAASSDANVLSHLYQQK